MLKAYIPRKEWTDRETGRKQLFKAYFYSFFQLSWSERLSFHSIYLSLLLVVLLLFTIYQRAHNEFFC